MRRPRAIPLLTTLIIGTSAVVAIGCGSGESLIPADRASRLDSALQQVGEATRAGDCPRALQELQSAQRAYAAFPPSVHPRLTARLGEGLQQLARSVPEQCDEAATVTKTTAAPTTAAPTTAAPTKTETTKTTTTTPTTTTAAPTTQPPGTGTTPNGGVSPGEPAPGQVQTGGEPGAPER